MLNADDEEQILEFNDCVSSGNTQPAEVYGELKLQVGSPDKQAANKDSMQKSTQRSAAEESVEADDDEDDHKHMQQVQ